MKRVLKLLLIVLIALVFVGTLVFLYQKSRKPPAVFQIGRPFITDIVKKTVVTGTVVPRKEIEIKPQLIGIIDEITVQAGEQIIEGDLIAIIRVTPNMVTLNSAETRLNQAKIAFDDALLSYQRQKSLFEKSFTDGHLVLQETNPSMIKLNASLFKVQNSAMVLEDTENEFDKQKLLLEKDIIAPEEFQNIELTLKKARSDFEEATRNYRLIREETLQIVEQDFQKAEMALKKSQEEFTAAKNNLQLIKVGVTEENKETANTMIRSTTDGMVLDVAVKEGNLVIESSTSSVGTTIATVADMNDMVFEGSIDESEVGNIKEGMQLILSIGAIENETFLAAIEYVSPKGKKVSGATQFDIRAKLQLKESVFVRSGYSATADIVLEKRTQVRAIEERWLQFKDGKPFVEVKTETGGFVTKPVTVGLSDGLKIEVLAGLTADDQIKVPD
jgi:HlyD family secretion protein